RPDLPRSQLVHRGPRQHQRLLCQRPPRRRGRPDGLRRRAADRPGPDAARTGGRMTVDATRAGPPAGAPALPRVLGPIRPRPRWLELKLLGFVAVALVIGSVSLAATVDGVFRLIDAAG